MAGSGFHEAVRGPARMWSVLVLSVIACSPGAFSMIRSAGTQELTEAKTKIEEQQKEINDLKVANGNLKQRLDDQDKENDRRFNELTDRQKDMSKILEKMSDKVDRIAEKVGAK